MTASRRLSAAAAVVATCVCLLATPLHAQPVEDFSAEAYFELEAAKASADDARASSEPSTPEHEERTREAMNARRAIIRYLTDWIDSGAMNATQVENAREARVVLVENLTVLHLELGQCDEAGRLLDTIAYLAESEREDFRAAYFDAVDRVARCQSDQPEGHATNSPPPQPFAPPVNAPVEVDLGVPADHAVLALPGVSGPSSELGTGPAPRRRAPSAGVALVAAGGVAIAAGAGWNVALLDERAEHQRLEGDCRAGSECDSERVRNLGDVISPAQGPIIGLVSGGAVVAGVGAILWARARRGAAGVDALTLDVSVAPGTVRAALTVPLGSWRPR